jgi:hypothetical protein
MTEQVTIETIDKVATYPLRQMCHDSALTGSHIHRYLRMSGQAVHLMHGSLRWFVSQPANQPARAVASQRPYRRRPQQESVWSGMDGRPYASVERL